MSNRSSDPKAGDATGVPLTDTAQSTENGAGQSRTHTERHTVGRHPRMTPERELPESIHCALEAYATARHNATLYGGLSAVPSRKGYAVALVEAHNTLCDAILRALDAVTRELTESKRLHTEAFQLAIHHQNRADKAERELHEARTALSLGGGSGGGR